MKSEENPAKYKHGPGGDQTCCTRHPKRVRYLWATSRMFAAMLLDYYLQYEKIKNPPGGVTEQRGERTINAVVLVAAKKENLLPYKFTVSVSTW